MCVEWVCDLKQPEGQQKAVTACTIDSTLSVPTLCEPCSLWSYAISEPSASLAVTLPLFHACRKWTGRGQQPLCWGMRTGVSLTQLCSWQMQQPSYQWQVRHTKAASLVPCNKSIDCKVCSVFHVLDVPCSRSICLRIHFLGCTATCNTPGPPVLHKATMSQECIPAAQLVHYQCKSHRKSKQSCPGMPGQWDLTAYLCLHP